MRHLKCFLLLTPAIFIIVAISGCAEKRGLQQTLRSNFVAPNGSPQILAAYQPWFGKPGHINVGYSTQDPVVLQQQIERAKSLGISSFAVNWYGPDKQFENRSYALLQQVAAQNRFNTAILYDESGDPSRSTEDAIRDLSYAYEHYIGPTSPTHSAYLTYDGRPMIFIFPKGGHTDWKKVRDAFSNWTLQPLLIYEGVNDSVAPVMDGFFAWVNPGHAGWQRDGSNWGEQYLANFYAKMTSKYPDKIAVGAAWPGFDDSRAGWSQNRHMSARCGKTFDDSLRLFRRYYDESHPLPFLMVVTWNDYEEGTAIEKGLGPC